MTSLEDYKAIARKNPGYLVFHFISFVAESIMSSVSSAVSLLSSSASLNL